MCEPKKSSWSARESRVRSTVQTPFVHLFICDRLQEKSHITKFHITYQQIAHSMLYNMV